MVASTRERLDSFTEAAQHDPLSVLFFRIDWRELVDVMDPGVLTLWTRCRIKHTSGERGERQSHSSISGPFGDESN